MSLALILHTLYAFLLVRFVCFALSFFFLFVVSLMFLVSLCVARERCIGVWICSNTVVCIRNCFPFFLQHEIELMQADTHGLIVKQLELK